MLIRKASYIFHSLLYSGTNHNYHGNHIFFGVGVGVYISTMKYPKADFFEILGRINLFIPGT